MSVCLYIGVTFITMNYVGLFTGNNPRYWKKGAVGCDYALEKRVYKTYWSQCCA